MYHILTHPTTFNYGGILQAYALQRVLFETEYNADTIEYNAQGQIKQNPRVYIVAYASSSPRFAH